MRGGGRIRKLSAQEFQIGARFWTSIGLLAANAEQEYEEQENVGVFQTRGTTLLRQLLLKIFDKFIERRVNRMWRTAGRRFFVINSCADPRMRNFSASACSAARTSVSLAEGISAAHFRIANARPETSERFR